jgi:hypothetical protein
MCIEEKRNKKLQPLIFLVTFFGSKLSISPSSINNEMRSCDESGLKTTKQLGLVIL